MVWEWKIKITALVIVAGVSCSGCYLSRAVGRMSADRYDIEPKKLINGSDGSLAVESVLLKKAGKETERVERFVYAPAKVVFQTIRKSDAKRSLSASGQKIKVYRLRIEVQPPENNGWSLLTFRPETGLPPGPDHPLGVPFDQKVDDRIYTIQVDSVKLSGVLKTVPSGRITWAQAILFLPALLIDIATSPIQFLIFAQSHQRAKIAL